MLVAAIGFGTAIEYLLSIGLQNIAAHEAELLQNATEQMNKIPGAHIIGTATHKTAVLSFTLDDIHPHDIGTILDQEGIAVRAGHHCAQPVMEFYNVPATARASFAFYNTKEEVDALCECRFGEDDKECGKRAKGCDGAFHNIYPSNRVRTASTRWTWEWVS